MINELNTVITEYVATKNTDYAIMINGRWVEKTRGQIIKAWIIDHILGRRLTDKIVQIKRRIFG